MSKNIILELQKHWKEGVRFLKKSTAESLGLDITKEIIEIGNFRIKKQKIFGGFGVEIIDKSMDLDGKPYIDNIKAINHIHTLYNQGIDTIHSNDLHQFNINTSIGEIEFGNVVLSQLGISQKYFIDLVDKEKTIDNKIKDEFIDYKKVMNVLKEYNITKRKLINRTEVDINKELETHFRKYFYNAHKSSGNLRGLFDLELGNLNFVIEIKLSSSLKKSNEKDRASGQVKRYLQEFKKKNFLMLVIGEKADKSEKNIINLEKEIINDFKCYYFFLEAN